MPTPRYFDVVKAPGRVEKWIGIEAESVRGGLKTFLYWRRIPGDLSTKHGASAVADTVTELTLRSRNDIAVGPAVRLSQCDPNIGHVEVDPDRQTIGLYVEESERAGAAMMLEEDYTRILDPNEVSTTKAKILSLLPTRSA